MTRRPISPASAGSPTGPTPDHQPRTGSTHDSGDDQIRIVAVDRLGNAPRAGDHDVVAREEPLEIQVGATSIAVLMRTPGHDEELAIGFLGTEGVIRSNADVTAVHHDRMHARPDAEDNVVRVHLRPEVPVDWEALRRRVYTSSSCGLCGKATIAQVLGTAPPLDDPTTFARDTFAALPDRLRAAQAVFADTGGLHAAALMHPQHGVLVVREDVGRHNAVDKVIGWALRTDRVPLAGHVLLVSGRISFEIVQKALAARVPAIAAISAPTSLAVELATAAHMLLIGFLRADRYNAYAAVDRLRD